MSGQGIASPHFSPPSHPRSHHDIAAMDGVHGHDPQASRHYSNGVYYAMLINVIIGAGVFSLPFGFHNVGSLLGAIFIFFFYGVNLLCVFYVFEALARADSWMKYATSASDMENSASDKHALLGRGHEHPEGDALSRPDPGDDSFRPAVPRTVVQPLSGMGGLARGGKGKGLSPSLATMREVCRMGDMKFSYVQLYEIFCGRAAKNATHTVLSLFIYSVMWAYTGVFASSVSNIVFRYALGRECDIYDDATASEWGCKLGYYAACALYALIVIPLSLRDVAEQATVQVILMCYRFLAFAVMLTTVTVALFHEAGISHTNLPASSPSASPLSLGGSGASITALGVATNVTAARAYPAPPSLPKGADIGIMKESLPHRTRALLSAPMSMIGPDTLVSNKGSVRSAAWGALGEGLAFDGPEFGSVSGNEGIQSGEGDSRQGGQGRRLLGVNDAGSGGGQRGESDEAGVDDKTPGSSSSSPFTSSSSESSDGLNVSSGGGKAGQSEPTSKVWAAQRGHADQQPKATNDANSSHDQDLQSAQKGLQAASKPQEGDGPEEVQGGALSWGPSWLTPKFGAFFGSVAVAFNCICYLPEVVHPVHPHKGRNLQWVAALSLATSTVFYLTLGLLCALLFREHTEPLVTLNWKDFTGYGGGFGPLPAEVKRVPFWALLVRLIVMLFPVGDMISVFPIQAVTLGNNLRSYVPDDWVAAVGAPRVKVALRMLAAIPPLVLGSINGKLDELFSICGLGAYLMAFIGPALLQLCSVAVMRRHLGPGAEVTAYSLSFFGGNAVTSAVLAFGVAALAFSTYVLVAF